MKKKIFFCTIIFGVGWFIFFIYVLISSIPESPIKFSITNNNFVKYYFSQGWSFFTKSPRDKFIQVFKKVDGKWQLFQQPNSSPKYLFGLKKDSRAMGVEYGRALNTISQSWIDFEGYTNGFKIADTLKSIPFVNSELAPLLKGEYILIVTDPIPWAWNNSFNKENIKGKLIKINSICEN
ncbi:SdpA family antimicrobial peptide system protein [Sinomicrobium sp. M5D2P17]